MVPSEDVLCAAVELATQGASAAVWDALEESSALYSVGQERLEVLELRGLAALRGGRRDEAVTALEKAIAAAARISNVMGRACADGSTRRWAHRVGRATARFRNREIPDSVTVADLWSVRGQVLAPSSCLDSPKGGEPVPDTVPVPVVLVVDVDLETHLVTERSLPETECIHVGARSAEMALKLAERRPPSVLVVDGKIGGLMYLAERLRRLSPHLHLLVLVAPDHKIDPAAPRQPGGTSLLRKPIEAVRYRNTLRTVLRLAAMAAGVKRMHGAGSSRGLDPEPPVRVTPLPRTGPARDK